MATRIRELLKTAFEHEKETVETYVALADLVRAMEDALRVSKGVIEAGQSEAAYVHGS